MNSALLSAVNKQILHEQTIAHAFDAVSLYFGRVQLPGLGVFMRRQMREERRHARRLIRHVAARGGEVELASIPAPKSDFSSPLDAASCVLHMQCTTTELIYRLHEMAGEEKDSALEALLDRFVTRQVANEKWTNELSEGIEQFQDRAEQMVMLDAQWGRRRAGTKKKRMSVKRR
jgi:ferritin